jgi:hypothetical protein
MNPPNTPPTIPPIAESLGKPGVTPTCTVRAVSLGATVVVTIYTIKQCKTRVLTIVDPLLVVALGELLNISYSLLDCPLQQDEYTPI